MPACQSFVQLTPRGNTYEPMKNQPNLKLTYEVRKFIEQEKWKTNYDPLKRRN